jgi:hypothetical protein
MQWILGPGRAVVEGSESSSEGEGQAGRQRPKGGEGEWLVRVGLELGACTWRENTRR